MSLAERVVLNSVYRLTAGYGRQSYRIKYSQLKIMSGVAGISRIVKSLAAKKMFELSEYKKGGSYIFTIPLPITSGKHPGYMRSTPPSPDVNTPSPDVNSSRGAIDINIDNVIDNLRESNTLTNELIEEMKNKYPNKDVNAMLIDCRNYYKNKDVPLEFKFRQWCERERVDVGAAVEFKFDSTGKFRVGYCAGCGESESYTDNELHGDAKCRKGCQEKVLPDRKMVLT